MALPPQVTVICPHATTWNFLSNSSWTAPAGVWLIFAQCCGTGADGNSGGAFGGTGGGGGGYAEGIVSVIPGNIYTVTVGTPGNASSFETVQGDGGSIPLGGSGTGDFVINGGSGFVATGNDGGNGGSSALGAAGGNGGDGGPDPLTPGFPGTFPGAGGGGGGTDGESNEPGGAAGLGFVRLSVCRPFGVNNDSHQFHNSGPTNTSIPHSNPINQFTATKGIGLRRKVILGAAVSPPPIPPFCGKTESDFFVGPFESSIIWTVPDGVTSIIVECQGGGSDGDGASTFAGGGGGGGGYGASLLSVNPGDTYSIFAGNSGETSYFNGLVSGEGGSSPTGGVNNVGQFTANGSDGSPCVDVMEALCHHGNGGIGGASGSGASGGLGGIGAEGQNLPFSNGDPGGNYGGGGGGAGGTGPVHGVGGAGGVGFVRITWLSTFGFSGNGSVGGAHQTHSTGQTNSSLKHCTPINKYTTTKGIGLRRKYILGAALLEPPLPPGPILECTGGNRRLVPPVRFEAPTGGGDIVTTWTVPKGVCQILVQCQADGGQGGEGGISPDNPCSGGDGAAGGRAGGYGASIINVIPGQTYLIWIYLGVEAAFLNAPFSYLIQASSGNVDGSATGDFTYPGNPGWQGDFGAYQECSDAGFGGGGYGGSGGNSYSGTGGAGGAGAQSNSGAGGNGDDGGDWGGGGGGGGGGSVGPGGNPGFGGGAFVRISWGNLFGLKIPCS